MKKQVYRKFLVLGTIFLFLGASVISAEEKLENDQPVIPIIRGTTYYVGGSGGGNYTSIQDAIDVASHGDTVYVYDDSSPYYENVVVDKSINLTGENRFTTVIDANWIGTVVTITADWVNITGFTIQNCENDGILYQYKGIKCTSDNNFIWNNNFYSNWGGAIALQYSNFNVLLGNWIYNSNTNWGISLTESSNNELVDNLIESTFIGISVLSNSNYNFFLENSIKDTYEGLSLRDSDRNDFIFTEIEDCLDDGANIRHSDENKFFGGTIIDSVDRGLILSYSNNNEVLANSIEYNGGNGIEILYSNYNKIHANDVENNNGQGIYISGSDDNSLTNNTIDNNQDAGIYISSSNDNTIRNSTIENNNYGVYLSYSSENLIYNNYFANTNNAQDNGNNEWNIEPILGENIIGGSYLAGNYWDDDTSTDTDNDGLGDVGVPYNNGITTGGDYHPLKYRLIMKFLDPIFERGNLFFFGKLIPFKLPIMKKSMIIGSFVLRVEIIDPPNEIETVEFLIDGEPVYSTSVPPYEWKWKKSKFGIRKIQVNALDQMGNSGAIQTEVWRIL